MITAYKGMDGEWEEGEYNRLAWFTDDQDHAGYFGKVKKFQISPYKMIKIDFKNIAPEDVATYYDNADDAYDAIDAIERGGYGADNAIYDLMARAGADCIAIKNIEGRGVCYVAKCYCVSKATDSDFGSHCSERGALRRYRNSDATLSHCSR